MTTRAEVLHGITIRVKTAHGNLYLTVNMDQTSRPTEVFATMGRAGGCAGSYIEGLGRLISLALRAGISFDDIVRQLAGIKCGHPLGTGDDTVESGADAISKGLRKVLEKIGTPGGV